MGIKDRIKKLQLKRGPVAGGVIIELSGGGYRYQGQDYEALADLPHGGGVLLVPGELPPAEWDPWAVAVHAAQEAMIAAGRSHESRPETK